MLVNLQKRNKLINILPKKGSIADQMLVKDLTEKLRDIPEETKQKIGFKIVENNGIEFNPAVDNETFDEIDLSGSEKYILKKGVDQLDQEENVSAALLDLCLELKDLK